MRVADRTTRCGTPMRLVAALAIALLLSAGGLRGQALFVPADELVTAHAVLSFSKFHPGSTGYVAIIAEIADGWHINSNEPRDAFLIPTVLDVTAPEGIVVERLLYPEPEMSRLQISDDLMSLYHGRVVFGARLSVSASTPPGSHTILATLSYQGCNDMTCVEPADVAVEATLIVAGLEEPVEMTHEDIFSKPLFSGEGVTRSPGRDGGATRDRGNVGGLIEEGGMFLAFLFIFLAGLALNLTPCIYPLIPITVSYFGGQASGRTSRSFLLALVYVLGMSITYSILGVVAAMTGGLFGSALQNPWVVLFIAAVLVGLAASMFGLWELRMPSFLTRRTGTARRGFLGALFMGLTVGILAAPCIGPFVLGLLTYVGNLGKPVMGFLMFFTLAWGLGLPFLVLGTVSGSIAHLPRSGNWMIWVRKVFGFILVAMAVYFARPLIGPLLSTILYVAVAIIAGIFLGWISRPAGEGNIFRAIRRIFGAACILLAILLVALPGGPFRRPEAASGIAWTPYSEKLIASAAAAGKPVMIDFTADWCIPCHELEHSTFSDPDVVSLADRFVALKVDLTRIGDEEKLIKKIYDIKGVPTILFIDKTGAEREDLRVTGYIDARRFRTILEQAGGAGE